MIDTIAIYRIRDKILGESQGFITAPWLKPQDCSVVMNAGGNWWSARGHETSIYGGAQGYFARTKVGRSEKFFNGREVRYQRMREDFG